MAATGTATRAEAFCAPEGFPDRAGASRAGLPPEAAALALYGELVGDGRGAGIMEQRLLAAALDRPVDAEPADLIHRASVAAGYLALAVGCTATAAGIAALF